jgi:dienelactone hydrolase
MVSTTRVSRPTERRAIPAIQVDRCQAPIGPLDDIKAAVEALQQRSDVAAGPILIGGASRGGVLAIAYAGMHPEQVLGVLNFVGGWVGEGCSTAGEINSALFQRGWNFSRPTLWLYGQHDSFYSIEHAVRISTPLKKRAAAASFLNSQWRVGSATGSRHIQIYGPGMSRNIWSLLVPRERNRIRVSFG